LSQALTIKVDEEELMEMVWLSDMIWRVDGERVEQEG